MTIQEAIKSGKPFSRKTDKGIVRHWIVVTLSGTRLRYPGLLKNDILPEFFLPEIADILATDWEVHP